VSSAHANPPNAKEPNAKADRPPIPRSTLTSSALAEKWGLKAIGLRPPIPTYLRDIWQRRHFIVELTRARQQSENAESRLGQFWQLLNPLLNVGVYFLIFGVLLNGARATPYYISWLIIGVFIFTYTMSSGLRGARSIAANLGIVRALAFPRALLPISVVLEEFFVLGTALIVCAVAVLVQTAQAPTWSWLLIIPAVLLQTMFNVGLAFFFARITERVRDVAQLLPFLMRTWLYVSGIVIDFTRYNHHTHGIRILMEVNPGAVYPSLFRSAFLPGNHVHPVVWLSGALWGVLTLVLGFIYFWRAEARYGRG
jgi:teichoic acid transport system permease protein